MSKTTPSQRERDALTILTFLELRAAYYHCKKLPAVAKALEYTSAEWFGENVFNAFPQLVLSELRESCRQHQAKEHRKNVYFPHDARHSGWADDIS